MFPDHVSRRSLRLRHWVEENSRWTLRVTVTVAAAWSMRASMSPPEMPRTTQPSTSSTRHCKGNGMRGEESARAGVCVGGGGVGAQEVGGGVEWHQRDRYNAQERAASPP